MYNFLEDAVKSAAEIAIPFFKQGVEHTTKANAGDLLTKADLAVNSHLVSKFEKHFPDYGIYSEELPEIIRPNAEYQWIIDPIDGTRNFAHGIPMWCTMVALAKAGEVVASTVYAPIVDEYYFAELGKGALLNGKSIRVNDRPNFDHALGIGVNDLNGVEFDRFRAALSKLEEKTGWIVNYATNLSAAYLAAGKLDFYANNCGMLHDHAPVSLICTEAGAIATDSYGKPWSFGHRDLLLAGPTLHPQLLELFD